MKSRNGLLFLTLFLALVFSITTIAATTLAAPAGLIPEASQSSRWEIETVDARDNVGRVPTLALDSVGRPHLTYIEQPGFSLPTPLEYARWTGSKWLTDTIDADGGRSSLVIDDTGRPQVSFSHNDAGGLAYAAYEGSNWQVEPVDSTATAGFHNRLALDSSGRAHIIYTDYSINQILHAQQNGGGWDITPVITAPEPIYGLDFALDSLDRPHMVYQLFYCLFNMYYEECYTDVQYLYWDGSQWQFDYADGGISPADGGEISFDVSIALDSADNPHIAYFSMNNWSGILQYAHGDGNTFERTSFDMDSFAGGGLDLALSPAGQPHIAYSNGCPPFSGCEGELKYAWWAGDRWLVDTVEAAGPVGLEVALALDGNHPLVAYTGLENEDLNLARGLLLEPAVHLPILYAHP